MAGQTSLGQRQLLLLKSHRYVDRHKAVQFPLGILCLAIYAIYSRPIQEPSDFYTNAVNLQE